MVGVLDALMLTRHMSVRLELVIGCLLAPTAASRCRARAEGRPFLQRGARSTRRSAQELKLR